MLLAAAQVHTTLSLAAATATLDAHEGPGGDSCLGRSYEDVTAWEAVLACDTADGWNDIGDWLPQELAKAPLDVVLLAQVLMYWSPAQASQAEFNRECDRLESELASAVSAADDAEYLARRGGDW
jgi:hypothetical protein